MKGTLADFKTLELPYILLFRWFVGTWLFSILTRPAGKESSKVDRVRSGSGQSLSPNFESDLDNSSLPPSLKAFLSSTYYVLF